MLALNAYSGQFPFLRPYTTPMHTYTLVKGLVLGPDTLDEPTRAFLEYCGKSADAV